MILGLEFTGEYGVVQRNFDKLDAEVLGTGGIDAGIRFGTLTLTWPGGAAASNAVAVAHGLGTTPVAVVATSNTTAGTGLIAVVAFFDATTVTLQGETTGGFAPLAAATNTVSWIAIG